MVTWDGIIGIVIFHLHSPRKCCNLSENQQEITQLFRETCGIVLILIISNGEQSDDRMVQILYCTIYHKDKGIFLP